VAQLASTAVANKALGDEKEAATLVAQTAEQYVAQVVDEAVAFQKPL